MCVVCVCFQEVLDADDEPLKNKYGERMDRDIVQFVPLKKYTNTNFSLVSATSYQQHFTHINTSRFMTA